MDSNALEGFRSPDDIIGMVIRKRRVQAKGRAVGGIIERKDLLSSV